MLTVLKGNELKPFHETIVEDIATATNEELFFIASQLKRTVIPANHDRIITAWNVRRRHMCWAEEKDLGVPASLLQQKRTVEAKMTVERAKAWVYRSEW